LGICKSLSAPFQSSLGLIEPEKEGLWLKGELGEKKSVKVRANGKSSNRRIGKGEAEDKLREGMRSCSV
jgi:hypothetical protein